MKFRYLTTNDTETQVNAFVTSMLDHLNSLLYGLSQHLLLQLQRVQNSARHISIHGAISAIEHTAAVLKSLHSFSLAAYIVQHTCNNIQIYVRSSL